MSESRAGRVRVPASAANVGAGFDCIGFAVDRWLTASASISERPGTEVTVRRSGTLESLALSAADDTVVAGFQAACDSSARAMPEGLDFELSSEIPVSRGLGSSSAALVAGAMLANKMLGLGLAPHDVAVLCTEIEGHPDNVAPAVFGGAILGVPDARTANGAPRWIFAPIEVDPRLAFAFVVPEVMVETAAARAILPETVARDVAVRAAAKAAALAHGLATGDAALLRVALDDLLHVPHRRHLVPRYDAVVAAACAAGAYGATLSGSGSTLLAVSAQQEVEAVASAMQRAFADGSMQATAFVQREMLPRAGL